MWVEFVVGWLFGPRSFSPGTPVLPSPQKPTFPNSNSIWTGRRRTTCGCVLPLNRYLFYLKITSTTDIKCGYLIVINHMG